MEVVYRSWSNNRWHWGGPVGWGWGPSPSIQLVCGGRVLGHLKKSPADVARTDRCQHAACAERWRRFDQRQALA